jgi:hypothetical protein
MKQIGYVLILFMMLMSCNSDSQTEEIKRYFDLKGLIAKQIERLLTEKPLVIKTIAMADTSETQSIQTIDWTKELEFFTQTDLNKPAYINSYQVDSSSMGVKYVLKENEKLPVKYLSISRVGEEGIAVEALVSNDNYLYQTERHLKLSLNSNQVTDYQIDGFQKIVFGNKKPFKINGKVER